MLKQAVPREYMRENFSEYSIELWWATRDMFDLLVTGVNS